MGEESGHSFVRVADTRQQRAEHDRRLQARRFGLPQNFESIFNG
jgi:hypothetical protein